MGDDCLSVRINCVGGQETLWSIGVRKRKDLEPAISASVSWLKWISKIRSFYRELLDFYYFPLQPLHFRAWVWVCFYLFIGSLFLLWFGVFCLFWFFVCLLFGAWGFFFWVLLFVFILKKMWLGQAVVAGYSTVTQQVAGTWDLDICVNFCSQWKKSNCLHRRRFQNSFCVSVIRRKREICPRKDKSALSAQIAAGNCVAASNKLSKQEWRLGSTWVTNFVGSQSHAETRSAL